jgi:hypothetical protein
MLAKLLKYEFKATAGLLSLLSLAALGVGVLGGFLMRYNMNMTDALASNEVLSVVSAVVLPFIFLSLFAYSFGGSIYLIVRFYKHKFTDQGYLTFTLPVRGWKIYVSSLVNMMFWSLMISLVTVLSFVCVFFIGLYDTIVWHTLMELPVEINEVFDALSAEFGGVSVILGIVSFVSASVLTLTSITLGCCMAKKHKILASIGCYYGISVLISTLTTIMSSSVIFVIDPVPMDILFLPSIAVHILAILGGSWLSIWLMGKKLNLP